MAAKRPGGLDHVRGAARLATDATAGLADLVEAVHARVLRLPGVPAGSAEGRTTGITGLVYRSIRGITRLVGGSIDALLAVLQPVLGEQGVLPERQALVAALNGVLGDHLARTANPLAISMTLRVDGQALVLDRHELLQRLPQAGPRVLVMLHGLCMNDLQWSRDGHDHGRWLAAQLGYTPVYLHYNSGLHVSVNGQQLAGLLDQLMEQWPCPLEQLVLLGHSMGGLVARSAVHQASLAGQLWPQRLTGLLFLGSPHHGAPLERAGNWVDTVLGAAPYAAPFARLGKVRSAGITDLRHGNLLAQDWAHKDRFARAGDAREPVPLPEGVLCCAVAATIGQATGDLKDRLLGDGLVPVASALGQHRSPTRRLAFPPDRQWVAHGVDHMALLGDAGVAAQLRRWLGGAGAN